ncbi:competence protein ComER [Paenibacillus shirakamiensis]|uniref:Pyrroline-5-carboxylate reductase n=1 Tax=Paenibacillus shirakamiensis TaxID=1265935 RepID=A0ABS4JDD9_9BACL|nr:late competence protein ComER [Paenibacillus shirakamiensis]MBP1999126.1 competence protein ComER [Paenibacillus shirakamiensis]
MQIAFIGTGSMGGLLIESFLRSGALQPKQITASSRTLSKVERLSARYPGLKTASSNVQAALHSDIIFLCVKPLDFQSVLSELKDVVTEEQIVVSITSPILLAHLESILPSKAAKIIPTITHSVLSGASLCMYGERIRPEDRLLLEQLFSSVGTPVPIPETQVRTASDISSCGPAFLAYILALWADAAESRSGLDRNTAIQLGAQMLLGTGRLLTEGGFTVEQLQQRVAVPGGVTAEGLQVLQEHLFQVFPELIKTTTRKHEHDLIKLDKLFENIEA